MLYRVLPLLAVLALLCMVGAPALAADDDVVHEGTFVKAADGKLTIEGAKDKKEHTCMVHRTPRSPATARSASWTTSRRASSSR